MSWSRAKACQALYNVLATAAEQSPATPAPAVYQRPPGTLNAPAVVIGRPAEVRYGQFALSIDDAELPVICLAAQDGDDDVDALLLLVREALAADVTLGTTVLSCTCSLERNWRMVRIAGSDMLAAELVLAIRM